MWQWDFGHTLFRFFKNHVRVKVFDTIVWILCPVPILLTWTTFPVITKSKLELSQSHTSTPHRGINAEFHSLWSPMPYLLWPYSQKCITEILFYDHKFQTTRVVDRVQFKCHKLLVSLNLLHSTLSKVFTNFIVWKMRSDTSVWSTRHKFPLAILYRFSCLEWEIFDKRNYQKISDKE